MEKFPVFENLVLLRLYMGVVYSVLRFLLTFVNDNSCRVLLLTLGECVCYDSLS